MQQHTDLPLLSRHLSHINEKEQRKMNQVTTLPRELWPTWFNGKTISEPIFCQEFLDNHRIAHTENAFFTPDGKMTNENHLRMQIYQLLEPCANSGVTKKIDNIMGLLRIKAHIDELIPRTDRIYVQNGTLYLNGTFTEDKNEIVRSRSLSDMILMQNSRSAGYISCQNCSGRRTFQRYKSSSATV